ncbi:hypothetical protein [Sphingomonas bacterium]|uniref:hypothetical protein n=1 Tax=Sphingomonas bacterium TaxID=1895847 RepID=UPI0015774241|nr:hypothetical protein [Sphingomonas bacterium]
MTDPTHTEARDSHGRFAHDAPESAPPAGGLALVKDKAGTALEVSRDAAAEAARRASEGIEANPLGILVGGLALGALIGALLPRSAQEKELLAPVGKSLGGRARAAIAAARETGKTELGQMGLTKNAAQSQIRGLVESLVTVAQNVGTAAAKSAAEHG